MGNRGNDLILTSFLQNLQGSKQTSTSGVTFVRDTYTGEVLYEPYEKLSKGDQRVQISLLFDTSP
jgi:hypothetical protein